MAIDIIKDDEKRNKIRFISFIIPEFARAYKMDSKGYETELTQRAKYY